MTILSPPALSACGVALEMTPETFGELRDANDSLGDGAALRRRMQEDGYLLLRGVLDPSEILAARKYITDNLAEEGFLDSAFPSIDSVARPGADVMFRPDLALKNAALHQVLYSGAMMEIFARYFGEPVRHYDFTWLRATPPGRSVPAHCDIVYMGRGTFDVLTAWTPLGDIAIDGGALMILEGSHRKREQNEEYLRRDVDSYCANGPHAAQIESGEMGWEWDGALDHDAAALRRRLGGRWLSSQYQIGDVLIFTMATVHGSLDNFSNKIRLSSDSRYQKASEPADERWIGPNPIGHGLAGKRGRIC
ncbi:hypothetical protein CCAX7_19110 [Capsulimonas corticalis]|uniref:Uncharacterized protein n=1 Tax=Capsulimonas corticalis TaxID=2219043 RepID=A0A402D5B7_9BACT|nr:phytanoyl-CoA dioxygenase family protein [Capsulimonas corticalis]BDI29860.1 hypothetical protein CCAX7_19110 [Capsulimonas corticalis]